MTKEQVDAIPHRSPKQILADIPLGAGHWDRVELALEEAMNIEWWRGFYAGTKRGA